MAQHFKATTDTTPATTRTGVGHAVLVALWAVLLGIAAFTFRLVDWVFLNWGNLRMDELLYTMGADLTGTNPETIRSGLMHTVPFAALAIALAVVLSLALRKAPKALSVVRKVTALAAVLVIAGSAAYFFHTIGLGEYVESQGTESTFIEEHYADPAEVQITFPEQRRNLIFLFVESMEMTYSDAEHGGAKPENIIPELTELGLENETFSGEDGVLNGGYALFGATYTMGGLFAQTSGLPLKVRASTLSVTEGFIPGIATLGEVLQDAGYHNYFLLGTDAAFGDRDKYFVDHGDFTLWDYNYSLAAGEIPADYSRNWWGYDDYILYDNAKAHLLELAETGEPFNLTMLTVDTHAENGYLCELCDDRFGDDRYANSLACASRQAYDFVRWCQEQDFYENTTIVVVGDHCTMDHDFTDDMDPSVGRRIYTTFINPAAERQTTDTRVYCSMDNFPTVVASLGATIEGDRLGLGTNLFSSTPTLAEELGLEEFDTQITQGTSFFDDRLGEEAVRNVQATYNDKTGCVDIAILDNVRESWDYDYIFGIVTSSTSDRKTYFVMNELEDGTSQVSFPLSLFGYEPGTYSFDIRLRMSDSLSKWYDTEQIELTSDDVSQELIDNPTPRPADQIGIRFLDTIDAGTFLDVAEEGVFTAQAIEGDHGPVLEVTFHPQDGASYDSYSFPVWSVDDGQDDVRWYGSTIQEDGSVVVRIDLTKHCDFGFIEVDCYGDGADGKEYQGFCVISLS